MNSFTTLHVLGGRTEKPYLTKFMKSCYRTWHTIEKERHPSAIILEAFYFLEEMQYTCKVRHTIAQGLFVVDCARLKNKKFAVELLGLSPRFKNRDKVFGEVLWRRSIIELSGYSVICLDEDIWASLDDAGKVGYLYNLTISGDECANN